MPTFPLMAERPVNGGHLAVFKTLYARGVRIFHVDATCTEDLYHPELRAWISADRFDYSYQENYWRGMLEDCPEAKLCFRMYVGSPPWWDAAHPDELQRYADGRVDHSFQRTDRKTLPSLASLAWRRDATQAMKKFLTWLDASPWRERAWGIFLGYGITWEWGILGSDDFLDYSTPMRERFRGWLRERYGDVGALRAAWGESSVTFESAEIPTKDARLREDNDLRIFPRDRASFDFQNCLSDVNVEYMLALARSVRETSGDHYKLGTFYGYTLTAREHNNFTGRYGAGGLHGGHHALRTVLDSKLFDFGASPYAYGNRNLGSGLLIQHFPLASAQHHGWTAYDESDLSTFTSVPEQEGALSRGYTATQYESVQHQRMAFMQAMCRGTSWWWTELTGWVGPYTENYSDGAVLEEIGKQVKLYAKFGNDRTGKPRRSAAQIAIIVDERSIASLGLSSKLFLREIYQQLPAWAWCGAPFDVWLSSDVSIETMRPYKLAYVFAPYLDETSRAQLRNGLCHSGRTVWWAPFTGLLTDAGPDIAAFRALTQFTDPNPAEDLQRSETETWISLYGRAEGTTSIQLSEIARAAGVHLFATAPVQAMASDDFVGVHVRDAGAYTLALPAGRWRDVISGTFLESNTWQFDALGVALFHREQY